MRIKTMYLPGFTNLIRRSRAKTEAAEVLREAQSIDGLAALVSRFIPTELFKTEAGHRKRLFTPMVTFTAFLGQVMRSSGAAERVRTRIVDSWLPASIGGNREYQALLFAVAPAATGRGPATGRGQDENC